MNYNMIIVLCYHIIFLLLRSGEPGVGASALAMLPPRVAAQPWAQGGRIARQSSKGSAA